MAASFLPVSLSSLLTKEELAPSSPEIAAIDSMEARAYRAKLVDELVLAGDIEGQAVRDAMRRVPRHAFVPQSSDKLAYENFPLPIGHGQTVSEPAIVAMMTQALELKGDERVLEIGTGCGYQSAVLSLLAREVCTMERIFALSERARKLLAQLGYENVRARVGDGYEGWPERAPFDRILLTTSPPWIPESLMAQLAVGGILVAPIGSVETSEQGLVRIRKEPRLRTVERLCKVRLTPMLEGVDPPEAILD